MSSSGDDRPPQPGESPGEKPKERIDDGTAVHSVPPVMPKGKSWPPGSRPPRPPVEPGPAGGAIADPPTEPGASRPPRAATTPPRAQATTPPRPPGDAPQAGDTGDAPPPPPGEAGDAARPDDQASADADAGAEDSDVNTDPSEAADPDEDPDLTGAGLVPERLVGVIESLLFVSDRPVSVERLRELLPGQPPAALREALQAIEDRHRGGGVGLRLHQVAGGYQLRTAPANAGYVQRLLRAKPVRLSRAQLETLAIVAYRQPVTRPEIDDIRGVDSGGSLKMLLERSLVRILGKREEPGRPILYGTTREFLEFFNLRDLRDLPTLREFHELSEEHQQRVGGARGLVDLEGEDAPPPPEAAETRPPPLTRVELKDLDLGDDQGQLDEIDQMIEAVSTDFKLDEILGTPPAAPGPAAPTEAPADKAGEDEREPEEL